MPRTVFPSIEARVDHLEKRFNALQVDVKIMRSLFEEKRVIVTERRHVPERRVHH